MKKQLLSPFLILVIALASCSKSEGDTNPSSTTLLNLAYGTAAQQRMDLYLPNNRNATDTRLLIMIHGGGWSGGDKADLQQFVDTMKRRLPGYAIANINYRLAAGTSNLFPTQEMDVKAA